jgi:hypothetical protein
MPGKAAKKTFVDVVTGKIGKLTGLLTGIAALLAVATQLLGGFQSFQRVKETAGTSGTVAVTDCLDVTLDVKPTMVSVGKWNTVRFDLIGRNTCKEPLTVYVAFKSLNGSIRIEPLVDQPACSGTNPDCWESRTLGGGKDVKWTLTAPRLTQLSPLTDPVQMSVNWIVYNTETKRILRGDKIEISVRGEATP